MAKYLWHRNSYMFHYLTTKVHQAYQRLRATPKPWLFLFAAVAAGVVVFGAIHGANAAPTTDQSFIDSSGSWFLDMLSKLFLWVATWFIKLTLFMFSFVIELAAYNGYLDATAVQVGWVMVRDITNMFFVVALLAMAFGTILGIEQYEWKKLLVKFVLAAILVNFSRVICGVLIDISQLIMTTFVNGIVATAGGNIINMFNFQKMLNMHTEVRPGQLASPGIFTATVAALTFSGMAMAVIAIFLFILVSRLIGLWILIVLSPLAFVLTTIPATQSFANKWWSELGDRLVTGPVLLFFIWLSFVTVGVDQGQQIGAAAEQAGLPHKQIIATDNNETSDANTLGGSQYAGVTDAMGWNNMANFVVAIGMLVAGAKVASEIGGSSGSALTGVASFGKKVATIASGYALGRYLYEGGKGVVQKGGVGLAKGVGKVIGVQHYAKRIQSFAATQLEGIKAEIAHPGERVKMEKVMDADGKERWKPVMEKDKETGEERFAMEKVEKRGGIAGWLIGRANKRMMSDLTSEKVLEKTKKFAENRKDLLKARITGVPKYWMQRGDETEFGSDKADAIDRMEQGMLAQEKERSAAKTAEFQAIGKAAVAGAPRVKYKGDDGTWAWLKREIPFIGSGLKEIKPEDQPYATQAQEIAAHRMRAERNDQAMKQIEADARVKLVIGKEAEGRYEGKFAEVLKAAAAATERTATSEAQLKKAKAAEEAYFIGTDEGKKGLAVRTAAEKEAHLEEERVKTERKVAEKTYLAGPHGIKERQTAAELEARTKSLDSFIANLKDQTLTGNYTKARKAVDDLIDEWKNDKTKLPSGLLVNEDTDELTKRMAGLAKNNAFVDAMAEAELAKIAASDKKMTEAQAVDSAANGVVNLQRGRELPSDAVDAVQEEKEKLLSGKERTDASKSAADSMFFLMAKAMKKKLTQEEKIDIMGSWGKIDFESWNDDFADYMVREMASYKQKPGDFTGQRKIVAEQMQRMEKELGLKFDTVKDKDGKEVKDKEGNVKYRFADGYDRKLSASLQNMSATGGNTQLVKAHQAISDWQAGHTKEEWNAKGGYWGVAKHLSNKDADGQFKGFGATYDVNQMEAAYRENQELIKIAAKKFKKNGIDGGHWESVLNQEYDDKKGMYRFNTEQDAASESVTEMGKRDLNTLLKSQVHSYGNLDLNNFLMQSIDPKMFQAITAQLKKEYEVRGMNYRSLVRLFGYHEDEKEVRIKEGHAHFGGERMLKEFDGKEEAMDNHVIKDMLVPMLQGNATAFALMIRRLFNGHISANDASHGNFKIAFESYGKAGTFAELQNILTKNQKAIGLTDENITDLKKMAEKFEAGVVMSDKGAQTPEDER